MSRKTVVVGLGVTGFSCIQHLKKYTQEQLVVVDSRRSPPFLSALRSQYPEIPFISELEAAAVFQQADRIIVSPGVPLQSPFLQESIRRRIRIENDIGLFLAAAPGPFIAVTGSNGKTTVTSLLTEMLLAAGYRAIACGNIGVPVLDTLEEDYDFRVLELSSFQLECLSTVGAAAAVCLNITPDHLDRHGALAIYGEIKKRVYRECCTPVINREAPETIPAGLDLEAAYSFGLGVPQTARQFGLLDRGGKTYLALGKLALLGIEKLPQQGFHHYQNILCACALALAVGVDLFSILEAAKKFPGISHRCEYIGNYRGVCWINDSKSTNIGAVEAAIQTCFPKTRGRLIWIAGGESKGADFTLLRDVISGKVQRVFLFGKDSPKIDLALRGSCEISLCENLEEVVQAVYDYAISGDKVLFSPGCASFDMFKNYADRGVRFMQEVRKRYQIQEGT